MATNLPETTHFGLTRYGAGEAQSKNGWAASDSNWSTTDKLLYAALNHTHTGDPALGNPTDPPTFTAVSTGGTLPAGTTYYYRVTFVDQWGLETAASPEGSVTTANPLTAPVAPATVIETSSGTVSPGVYSYLVTYVDAYGGETTPSPLAAAQVLGGATNRIRLNLPTLPSGAVSMNIYRSRPGQSKFYYLGNTSSTTFYDAGSSEDQTVEAPTRNTTNASNSIQVTIPLGFIPEGCYGWKIYRAVASGNYDGTSLVHWVVEGASDTDTTPRVMWTDTGDALQAGFPPDSNQSAPSGIQLSYDVLTGSLPLQAMPRGAQVYSAFLPGNVTDGEVVAITEVPFNVMPTRLTAYFKTPPSAGTTVRIRVQDSAGTPNYVEVSCPSASVGSDPAGYYHIEYPLFIAEKFEAESGTRSSTATVAIASDVAASSGQAVALATNGDYVQMDLGALDAGSYSTFVNLRVLQYATSSTNDLVISVIRTDTNAVVGSAVSYTLISSGGLTYAEKAGPVFTAPGGVDLVLRVAKGTPTTQAYNIDYGRFVATVPTLTAGILKTIAHVDSGPTSAADVNVALWF